MIPNCYLPWLSLVDCLLSLLLLLVLVQIPPALGLKQTRIFTFRHWVPAATCWAAGSPKVCSCKPCQGAPGVGRCGWPWLGLQIPGGAGQGWADGIGDLVISRSWLVDLVVCDNHFGSFHPYFWLYFFWWLIPSMVNSIRTYNGRFIFGGTMPSSLFGTMLWDLAEPFIWHQHPLGRVYLSEMWLVSVQIARLHPWIY